MGVVHRVIRLLCVLYDGGFWKGGIDLVGVYVEMNRRIALVGPNKSEQEVWGRTLNSFIRVCSSCNNIVLLSGVKFKSNVPAINTIISYPGYQEQVESLP
jgi:hypothetical protein